MIDNFLHGGVITSTNGTGLSVNANGGSQDDWRGVRAWSETGDGVFGWGFGPNERDTGVTGCSENGYGVYGFAETIDWGLYIPDDLFVGGSCTNCTLRYIAINDSPVTL